MDLRSEITPNKKQIKYETDSRMKVCGPDKHKSPVIDNLTHQNKYQADRCTTHPISHFSIC